MSWGNSGLSGVAPESLNLAFKQPDILRRCLLSLFMSALSKVRIEPSASFWVWTPPPSGQTSGRLTVAAPATSRIPAPTMIAVLSFVHAIRFKTLFTRVNVEPLADAPFDTATTVAVLANVAGAARTELADRALATIAVVDDIP